MRPTNDSIENTNFLLLCPFLDMQRQDLLARVMNLLRPFVEITNLPSDLIVRVSLYSDQNLPNDRNKNIIKLTSYFLHENGQFK